MATDYASPDPPPFLPPCTYSSQLPVETAMRASFSHEEYPAADLRRFRGDPFHGCFCVLSARSHLTSYTVPSRHGLDCRSSTSSIFFSDKTACLRPVRLPSGSSSTFFFLKNSCCFYNLATFYSLLRPIVALFPVARRQISSYFFFFFFPRFRPINMSARLLLTASRPPRGSPSFFLPKNSIIHLGFGNHLRIWWAFFSFLNG